MTINFNNLTISEARSALDSGKISAVELAKHYTGEIAKKNPELNAFLEVYGDVVEQAKSADEKIKAGKVSALTGIPLAIKDNMLINGRHVTSASKILGNYRATYDATVIEKLKQNGAVFLGRTNMDEFAMGGSNENSAFGPVKNPHDMSRVSGGSSGGSASAVSGGLALGALGSDTGGSIREPASFCGIVGLKPTYGRVSRYGLFAMGSSLDQIGSLTKTVTDAEIIFNVIAGKDTKDSTSKSLEELRTRKGKTPKVIGVPRAFATGAGVDKAVVKAFEESLEKCAKLGFEIRDIEIPLMEFSLPVYYIIMPAESSTNLARFDGMRYGLRVDGKNLLEEYEKTRGQGFGKEVRRRIILGTYVLSSGYVDAYYNKAVAVRSAIKKAFADTLDEVGIIATPTAPTPAFKIGEKVADPVSMYLADIFTVTANIVGVPAISLPMGMTSVGGKDLPMGIQFSAGWGEEDTLFDIGKKFLGEV